MKKVFFLLLSFLTISLSAQTGMTLTECLQLAIDNNILLKQSAAAVDYAQMASNQSRLLLLPNLNAGASYFWNFGYTVDPVTNLPLSNNFQANGYQLSSNLNLFSGGSVANTIKKSKVDLQLAQLNFSDASDNVQFSVITAYLSVLFAEEQLKVATNKIIITEEQLNNSRKLVAAGTLAEGTLLNIEAQLANDQLSKIQAQNAVDRAYLDLKLLLQLPPEREMKVVYPSTQQFESILNAPVPSALEVTAYAIANKASIKKFDLERESNEYARKIAGAASMPSLLVVGQLSTNYSDASYAGLFEPDPFEQQIDNNLSEVVGLTLQIPIFNNGQVTINKQSADLNLLNTDFNRQNAINTLTQNVTQAINDLKAAIASYDAANTNYEAAKKAFDFAKAKFSLGTASSYDYNTALNAMTQAESLLIQAKYDLIFKSKIIDYYLDKPLDI